MSLFVGAPIITRIGNNQKLTEQGFALYRFAKSYEQIYAQLNDDIGECSTKVNICCDGDLSAQRLLQTISRFINENPDVTFNVTKASKTDVLKMLNNGIIDIGIVSNGIDLSAFNLREANAPYTNSIGVLIPTGIPLYSNNLITPERLIRYNAIFPSKTSIPDYILNWFRTNNIPRSGLSVYGKGNTILAVAKGCGYAFVPISYNEFLGNNLRVVPLFPELKFTIHTLYSPNTHHNLATRKLIRYFNGRN